MNRTRTCTNPTPKHGGKVCTGKSAEIDDCKTEPCPSWATWGSWTQCVSTRQRKCVLSGKRVEDKLCGNITEGKETKICKKCQGNWGLWGNWSGCLGGTVCGTGKRKRSRVCLPFPGFTCDGAKDEEKACNRECKKTWTEWGVWGSCSKTCGGGTRVRERRCVVAGTVTVVSGCPGSSSQSSQCNTRGCPFWIPGKWSACSVTCGSGTQSREQICIIYGTNTPSSGCVPPRPPTQTERCTLPGCPVLSNWGAWSLCKRCRRKNEIVQQHRTRSCVRQGSSTATNGCVGNTKETRNCLIPDCGK